MNGGTSDHRTLVAATALALLAFAGNSVLTRWAMLDGATDPGVFAILRLAAGAVCLWVLITARNGVWKPTPSFSGTASLFVYAVGFSFAYVTLDTGAGALILFGVVQITLFVWALLRGEPVPKGHYIGAALAFAGLMILFWPNGDTPLPLTGFAMMAAAGIAWGLYTALGRGGKDPTRATANNFIGAALCAAPLAFFVPLNVTGTGLALAIVSGAITSGLGYAVWYAVLPRLRSSLAAILQLTVPILAAVGGIVLFGESLTVPLIIASLLVLGGTVIAVRS